MALFRRKSQTEAPLMPPEVQDYYQLENRRPSWKAWGLGFITLVVTMAVVLGAFFGGRFIYHKLRNEPVTTVQTDNKPAGPLTTDDTPTSNTGTSPAASTPSTTTPAAPTTPSPAPATTPTPVATTTPAANSNLPNTGPGDTLAIFLAVSAVAYVLHRRYLAQNKS